MEGALTLLSARVALATARAHPVPCRHALLRRPLRYKQREGQLARLQTFLEGSLERPSGLKQHYKCLDVHTLSSELTQLVHGCLVLTCKSGKDRTGMAASLESIDILARHHGLPLSSFRAALDTMRAR